MSDDRSAPYAPASFRASDPPPARPRRPIARRLLGWIGKALLGFVIVTVLWVLLYRFVPPPITLTMAGDMLGGHSVTKKWMPLSDIDPDMPRAAIAGEDGRFCTHHGFDFSAMANAAYRNAQGGRIRGGSTISQQTAKNAFLFQGGGYVRKALEAYFTVLIEALWGKRRIMEVYLNIAETGIGTYGVEAGSIRYFGHGAARLSPSEAGRIAAILPLPKKRAAKAPKGFTRRHGNTIARRVGVVRNDRLDGCLG
ncbi:monofunctional biosynthetic peptidoglycan transglycosylase [Sphingomonas hylomeconis]|uniref:Biosynthetic peptidoglycan transglycosylase n=1 Tax=Sphingomonas hylomeconis TaxID=1395958 RepID=A0ABV7SUA0_9SPHN|nr:monofunctional biosynthetic peptidoglycan transglycosylase [Sphingomonas hylomeconis]